MLRGETAAIGTFDDDFDEYQYYDTVEKTNNLYFAAYVFICSMFTHFIFGDIERATALARKCPIHVLKHLYAHADFAMWSSLAYASMYSSEEGDGS